MVSSRSATLGLEVLVDDIMGLTFFTIILRNYNKMKKDVHYLLFLYFSMGKVLWKTNSIYLKQQQ